MNLKDNANKLNEEETLKVNGGEDDFEDDADYARRRYASGLISSESELAVGSLYYFEDFHSWCVGNFEGLFYPEEIFGPGNGDAVRFVKVRIKNNKFGGLLPPYSKGDIAYYSEHGVEIYNFNWKDAL